MSSYKIRIRRDVGEGRFAITETTEDLDVWALRGTPEEAAEALVTFLNAAATRWPAHQVRIALAPFSDLPPLPGR